MNTTKHRKPVGERAVVVSGSIPLRLKVWADSQVHQRGIRNGFSGLLQLILERESRQPTNN